HQAPETPFPVLLRSIEALSHRVTALQVLVAGFASTAYNSEIERAELFGMPTGNTAFRNTAGQLPDAPKDPIRQAETRRRPTTGPCGRRRFPRLPRRNRARRVVWYAHRQNGISQHRRISARRPKSPDTASQNSTKALPRTGPTAKLGWRSSTRPTVSRCCPRL